MTAMRRVLTLEDSVWQGQVKPSSFLQTFANRRMAVMLPLGFASGLPLPLTAGTLQAWLTVAGVDLRTIGVFTLVGLPYTLKFLWAPVMDRFVPSWGCSPSWWLFSLRPKISSSMPTAPTSCARLSAG